MPIAESEAVRLAELVADMPEGRREQIRARFDAGLRKLSDYGLHDRARGFSALDRTERMRLGGEYLRLRVACPFLEDENCSIYTDRPLRCREFLVTSPPENCANPAPGNIERPPSPPGPWPLVYRFEDGKGEDQPRWTALIFALAVAEDPTREPLPTYRAPEMFQNLLARLSATDSRGEGPDAL